MRRRRGVLVALLLLGAACGLPYPFELHRAVSGSMEPTIRIGDYIVWRRFLPGETKRLQRGDIIVFEFPVEPKKGRRTELYVKRVLGLPGETVRIADDAVWIDGRPVEEPWGRSLVPRSGGRSENIPDFPVGRDALYVLGDNRFASADSRIFGTVPLATVVGVVTLSGG